MPSPIKPKGPGRLAGKKIAGVKAPVVLVGLALAVGIGLYLRARAASASSGSGSTAAPAAADSGAGSGGASGSATDPGSGLADAIWGLTGVLGGSQFSSPSGSDTSTLANTSTTTSPTAQDLSAYQNADLARNYPNLSSEQQASLFPLGAPIVGPAAAPATANGSASGITIPTLTLPAAKVPAAPANKATLVQPASGAVSVKTLANGSRLYTYANGRQEQQVPGKNAYVVKKGN